MIDLSNDAIVAFMTEKGYKSALQKQTDQVLVLLNIDGMEYPLFIRILEEGPVLQLLVFIPCNIKVETLSEVARLLHLLNKEMDIPGFGMDETAGVIFYRVSVPSLNKKVDTTLLLTYINSIELICKSFSPVIHNVSHVTMSFEAVLKKAQEAHTEEKRQS
jgi:hypothetical protein